MNRFRPKPKKTLHRSKRSPVFLKTFPNIDAYLDNNVLIPGYRKPAQPFCSYNEMDNEEFTMDPKYQDLWLEKIEELLESGEKDDWNDTKM